MQTIEKIERPKTALHKCRLCCREYTTASALKWHVKDKHPDQFASYWLPAGHPAHVTDICKKIERKRKQADEEKKDKQDKQANEEKKNKQIKTKQTDQPQPTDKITKQLNKITEEIQKLRASLLQ